MARFLLVHGSCHGAWCWRDVIPELRALGHEAEAIDLPAHGDDPTPARDATIDLYADAILSRIDTPVTLVGHSAAGFPITLAADRAPEKIARLVYLCAYVPAPGLTMAEMRRLGPSQPLKGAIRVAEDGVTYTIVPERAPGNFYQDCSPEAVAYAVPRLCPEPILPQSSVLPPLPNWPGVEQHYIVCEDDQVIPPAYQRQMASGIRADRVTSLPHGHSPFFSAPKAVARRLDEIAAT